MEMDVQSDDDTVRISLRGTVDEELLDKLDELPYASGDIELWKVDLQHASEMGARGVAGLLALSRRIQAAGGTLRITGASEEVEKRMRMYSLTHLLEDVRKPAPAHRGIFEYVGQVWYDFSDALVAISVLAYDAAYWLFVAPVRGKGFKTDRLLAEISRNGAHGLPILCLVAFLFGVILSINGAYLLSYWDQNQLIADMIGVGFTREIGPALVGIMLAARSGAAISAELGTMKVREEIDAMWTMGMNPAKFLIVPKVTALALIAPIFTVVANTVGIGGSFIASTAIFGVNGNVYINRLREAIYLQDLITGLGKSMAFGIIIGFVGCGFGLAVEGGAEEVGNATTRTVVWSIVLVIVADGIFSSLFYVIS
ncbi:MAG: ABC transporter permease [Planctomycetota bacterium]